MGGRTRRQSKGLITTKILQPGSHMNVLNLHLIMRRAISLLVVTHNSFVCLLFDKCHVILRPVTRTCPTLVLRPFLVKDFFQVACEYLSEN